MKIGAISADWEFQNAGDRVALIPGGTNWLRVHVPCVELKRHGYDIVAGRVEPGPDGALRVQDFEGEWHDDCDLIFMQRWLPRPSSIGPETIARAVATGQVVVNDVDDHHWAMPATMKNTVRNVATEKATRDFAAYRGMVSASSAVICSTPLLARTIEKWGPPTFLCRNAIDIGRWNFDTLAGEFVGWVAPIRGHMQDVQVLREAVVPVLRELGLPLYHGGHAEAFPLAARLDFDNVMVQPQVPTIRYPGLWAPVGVGLVPLEDSTFNRAKSWCKGLEGFARGVPVIASRLPEYELLGGAVRLAKKRSEWRKHLLELSDPEVRRHEGRINRQRAEELSIGNQWHQWDEVFRELVPASAFAPRVWVPAGV